MGRWNMDWFLADFCDTHRNHSSNLKTVFQVNLECIELEKLEKVKRILWFNPRFIILLQVFMILGIYNFEHSMEKKKFRDSFFFAGSVVQHCCSTKDLWHFLVWTLSNEDINMQLHKWVMKNKLNQYSSRIKIDSLL